MMLAELAPVVAGGNARHAALGTRFGDRFQAGAHGVGDRLGGQTVNHNLKDGEGVWARERVGRRRPKTLDPMSGDVG